MKKIDFFKNQYENGDILVYALVLKEINLLIGHISVSPIKLGYEIGYSVAEDFRKQGFASEAVPPFSLWAKEKLNIREIYAIVKSENISSVKTVQNAGFSFVEEKMRNFWGENFMMSTYVL